MIRIAIVEDEQQELDRLSATIDRYARETGEACCHTQFRNGLDFIDRYQPVYDVVFMDIDMPYLNGIAAAQKLREQDGQVLLVFITNLKQYALKGYEYEAMDYLVKPISYPAFSTMMGRVQRRLQQRPDDILCITNTSGIFRIAVGEIQYVEVLQHYICYHTVHGNYRFFGTLANEEKRLPADRFAKCSKSYLVNLAHVKKVVGSDLYLADTVLPISRGQRRIFLERLMTYMERQ